MTIVPIRPAATLVVVRDGGDGIEVCVLRRRAASVFVGGAFVFPGGAVDRADAGAGTWLAGAAAAAAADGQRAAPFASAAHRVAAIRETLEECALLVAASGPLAAAPAALAAQVSAGGAPVLAAACQRAGLTLQLDALHYLAHWVTPAGAPRRYDTRFFITAAPTSDELQCDGTEAVEAHWIGPRALLDRHAAGNAPMLPPTIATLRWLTDFATAQAATEAAAALTSVPRIEPRVVTDHRGKRQIVTDEDPAWESGYRGAQAIREWPRP